VAVTDANGGRSSPGPPVYLGAFADPSVGTPTLTPVTATVGEPVSINASLSGGSGGLTYSWNGLPPGCHAAGGLVSCRPTQNGTYLVSLSVTDSNGFTATSPPATLVVQAASGPGGGPAASPEPLDPTVALGIVVVVAAVAVAVLVLRRRGRRSA
jgi:hypothetical protein